jgi:hypothetical protein
MTAAARRSVRCAIYTRVSTEAGLDQDFNSLDAQYDAPWFGPAMTMAAFRADRPTALPCNSSSPTFVPTASISLSSTKSIA